MKIIANIDERPQEIFSASSVLRNYTYEFPPSIGTKTLYSSFPKESFQGFDFLRNSFENFFIFGRIHMKPIELYHAQYQELLSGSSGEILSPSDFSYEMLNKVSIELKQMIELIQKKQTSTQLYLDVVRLITSSMEEFKGIPPEILQSYSFLIQRIKFGMIYDEFCCNMLHEISKTFNRKMGGVT